MTETPYKAIKEHWLKKIRLGLDHKKDFQKDADEGMKFFNGPYDFLYDLKRSEMKGDFVYAGPEGMPRPRFCMTHNKVAEAIQLFGPYLYHTNPVRTITPRQLFMPSVELFGDPNDPMVQAQHAMTVQQVVVGKHTDQTRADLMLAYQNYTPVATDLKSNARRTIDEAFIKGMGLLRTQVYQPPGTPWKMVASFHESVDNYVMDPDVENRDDCKWTALWCLQPAWQVEEEYGLPPGSLRGKGSAESYDEKATQETKPPAHSDKQNGRTNDLIGYWKVWSKMGLGGKLSGIDPSVYEVDVHGNYVFLAICEKCDYPLNIPPELWADPMQVGERVQWETPYWADDAWPCTPFIFHEVPRKIWPMSHFKPAMGELKFLNWVYSFLASKVGTACRDLIVCAKRASEEIKRAIVSGTDYELIEIEASTGKIGEIVEFLQHPPFHGDILKVVMMVNEAFERRVGLTELMYGSTPVQMRSAEEAAVKANQLRVRPDDLANKVEDAMTDVARREALAARWNLEPQDVEPILGPVGAQLWGQFVTPTDPSMLLHQLEYRIEAGSARKPNKDKQVGDATAAMQNVFQPLFQYSMQSGDVGPTNAVLEMWAKANDIEPEKLMLQPPMMPPVDPATGMPMAPTPDPMAQPMPAEPMMQEPALPALPELPPVPPTPPVTVNINVVGQPQQSFNVTTPQQTINVQSPPQTVNVGMPTVTVPPAQVTVQPAVPNINVQPANPAINVAASPPNINVQPPPIQIPPAPPAVVNVQTPPPIVNVAPPPAPVVNVQVPERQPEETEYEVVRDGANDVMGIKKVPKKKPDEDKPKRKGK